MTSTDRIEAAYHPFEGGSVPRARKKQTTSSWLSPARFCLGVCFLLTGCIATGIVYVCYTAATTFWQIENAPHLDKHANASLAAQPIPLRDANVVRSFFGPKDAGGVDMFDLKAALWVKVLKPDVHWLETPWELVYDATVLENVPIDTKPVHAVQQVRLPKELVHELATSLTAEVAATYAMVPSESRIDPALDHHTWRTSRNASVFGVDKPLPPFTREMINPPKDVFPRFVANSGTAGRMLLSPADNEILVAESGLTHSQVEALFPGRHIATKSRVTMVRDFPVYDFDAFNRTLLDRSKFLSEHCFGGTNGGPACERTYGRAGHFENLIEFDDAVDGKPETATRIGWRYGPFLTTKFGHPGPLDYKHIIGNETEDVVYDWDITWSSVTPGRLGTMSTFLKSIAATVAMPHNRTEYELASAQQMNEFWHVVTGHDEPRAVRPVTRLVLEFFGDVTLLAQEILEWHFWATRSVATGISLPMELVTSTYFALQGISSNVTHISEHGFGAAAMLSLVFLVLFLIPYFTKLSLYLRLEWQWSGPRGWIPVGVTKRRATHSERNSARADAKFDWKLRIALGIASVLITRLAPGLPPLIPASRFAKPEGDSSPATATMASSTTLNPLKSRHVMTAFRVVNEASQLHLIYRLGVFASAYRITASLVLLHSLLELVPRFIWTWSTRPAVTLPELAWVAGEVALCWAAWTFPGVSQEEEEEEE